MGQALKTILGLLMLGAVAILLAGPPAVGKASIAPHGKLAIDDISLTEKDRAIYLYFSLVNGFSKEIEEIVKSGIPVTYEFDITVTRKGTFWNSDLVNIRLKKVLSFDNIRDQYLVKINYPHRTLVNLSSMEDARNCVTTVKDLPVVRLSELKKGTSYTLRLHARVEKSDSRMPFYGLMKMFSSFSLESESYEVQFAY